MTLVGNPLVVLGVGDHLNRLLQAAFTCDECSRMSIGMAAQTKRINATYGGTAELLNASNTEIHWLPARGVSKEFPDVPPSIAAAASEAYQCRSIDATRAAILLARAVIEATAKDRGITTGSLRDKIDMLREQDFIREHIKQAAHEARYLGNDMAHGDFEPPAQTSDADEALTIMDEILAEVFQGPARTQRLREAREARRTGS